MNTELLAEKFPYARFHQNHRIVTWFPTGVLDNERSDRVVEFLESQELGDSLPFHRFTDLSGYTRIQLGLDHIVRLARRRKKGYKGPVVRSAFFAVRLISLSIAKMYEELMLGSLIRVATFRDRNAAADWLGVPANLLRPPNAARSHTSSEFHSK